MSTETIARSALYQEVAERLRSRIFAHQLTPGAWIDEQALAESFGISRTPMREALKVLAAEGLVTLKPRRGCYVTEVTERDLDEIFQGTIIACLHTWIEVSISQISLGQKRHRDVGAIAWTVGSDLPRRLCGEG